MEALTKIFLYICNFRLEEELKKTKTISYQCGMFNNERV
jgi:hypothetical protein